MCDCSTAAGIASKSIVVACVAHFISVGTFAAHAP